MTARPDMQYRIRSTASGGALGRIRHAIKYRDDSGQVIVIVLVLVILLAALAPVMVSQITSDIPLLTSSTNTHAALAAAEAGIQWYRDNLGTNSSYYTYTASNNPTGDAALSGWCGQGGASTCDLGGTTPAESFHYVPDDSNLFSQTGSNAGTVVLTVTGRAGTPGHYSYITARTSFSTSSVLDNAYYSSYEVLDPSSQTIQGIAVTTSTSGGAAISIPETQYDITYTPPGASQSVTTSVWQALCQYTTYTPNALVDALGLTIGSQTYSVAYPYYGPYFESQSFTFNVDGTSTVSSTGATAVTVPSLPCESPYDFVSGESFNGPVYTNDQLHVCGSPNFNGSPVSLTSGAPATFFFTHQVNGAVPVTASNQAQHPGVPLGDYVPLGYTTDNVNCSGSGDTPVLAHGVALSGTQTLPTLNTSLAQYGTASPPNGTSGTGCTFVGPTMIELVTSGSTTTMDVWSPLSTDTTVTTPACSNPSGQTSSVFSATTPFLTGIPLPSDGVIYVQDYKLKTNSSGTPIPPTLPNDGSTPCFNPYQEALPATSAQCYEGDVYIEGQLSGQLTVASTANIMVTRDLTYACADGSGGANATNPSSLSACTSSSTPDVLGLSAKYDILISGNDPSDSLANTQDCVSNGFGDGTGSPTNTGTVINGTPYPNDPAAVWPTVCNPTNIIIDAALFALQGSFGVEHWDTTPQSGNANLNGSDLSLFRGPFGYVGSTGYYKNFSYDMRLKYAAPPHSLQGTVPLWQEGNYIVCPTSACPPIS